MAEGTTTGSFGPVSSGLAEELAAAGFENAQQVARGGAGVIYRCNETALGRHVAVKVLPSSFDEESRERFLREGYAMGGLSGHPNIVNILRVGVTPSGKPYIVMPYHPADSLAVRLRQEGPTPWPEALRLSVKLCGALETAHRSGTLHRDIKPANVLVNEYGEPLLSDFGIAHVEGGYETATGFFSGTIDYTAPEVMTGNPATVASDIYSLGATIFALIAGRPPHERKSGEDLVAQYLRISTNRVPDLRPEGIPDAVCLAVEKAMAIDPAERPTSAEQFGRELQQAQRNNGLKPDSMAITNTGSGSFRTVSAAGEPAQTSSGPPVGATSSIQPPTSATSIQPPSSATSSGLTQQLSDPGNSTSVIRPPIAPESRPAGRDEFSEAASMLRGTPSPQPPPPVWPPTGATHIVQPHADPTSIASARSIPAPPAPPYSAPPSVPASPTPSGPVPPRGRKSGVAGWFAEPGKKRNRIALVATAAVVAVLLVVGGVFLLTGNDNNDHKVASQPSTQAPAQWKPITSARIARDAAATTQTDGTIWIFGGIRSDGAVTPRARGLRPGRRRVEGRRRSAGRSSAWMAVTWQDNPIVLGGWNARESCHR